ncbi:uncharacterized protein LOC135465871 isoform X2 [Liolophura sinensis]|uniref:uncharacterized protein LOC135465871 isoform X2 n=1 Tax=Liolophura sinensis TaxID=3198878 RepID=UPI0031594150
MHFCHQSVQLQQGNTHLVEENEAKFAARGSSANFKMAFSAMSARMELAHFASNVSNTSHMAPSNYRLQHVSGHPVVEAIQQVLGDKTLSDLVMPNSVSGESSSLYHNQTTPILPGYNALCAPQKTSTLPLNLPTNQIYPITTESLLAHAYSVDAQHSVKVANALPASQTTAHQTRSPLAAARGELASLSQLSSLPDTVMSHLVNLCPPINSQAHPNAANVVQAQGTFHFAPANTMPNQPIHLSVTMPNLVTTERFLNNAHSNTLSTFQSSSTGLVSGQTPVRSFNLDAGNTHSGSQCAVPSAVQQQKEPFSTSAISAQSNPQVHTGIGMSHPAQHGGSYNFSSDSALSNLVTSSSLFTCTESAPLTSYAHTNQQVPDSSQSPEIQAPCSENPILPAQAGFAVKMEQMSDSDLARSSVECRNNLPAIPDNADLSSASCSGGTTIPMPSPDHTQLSIVSSNRNVNVIDSSASSFLRRLSQGGMEAGRTGDGTDVESPLKQFEQDHQTSMEGQDVFMSTIKTEML